MQHCSEHGELYLQECQPTGGHSVATSTPEVHVGHHSLHYSDDALVIAYTQELEYLLEAIKIIER